MFKKHVNFTSIPNEKEIVFVITLEEMPLDDLDYPEVVAIFKEFDSVEKYLTENNVISVGSLLTSDVEAKTKDIRYIDKIYEISIFDVNTGMRINV